MRRTDTRGELFRAGLLAVLVLLVGWLLLGLACRHPALSPVRELFPVLAPVCKYLRGICAKIAAALVTCYLIGFCVCHRLDKGFKYAFTHAAATWRIRHALLEAGADYAVDEGSGLVTLPHIKLEFNNDLIRGKVILQNRLKYDGSLENINLTPALGPYAVTVQYNTDDGNSWVYEIERADANTQLVFDSLEELQEYSKKFGSYHLFMDKNTHVDVSSSMITGETGSGKSVAIINFIFQMLSWEIRPILWMADPKWSDCYLLGQILCPDRTAANVDEIIALLMRFGEVMQERKQLMAQKLVGRINGDYRDFLLPAIVLVLEEYAAFSSVLETYDKKTRDRVNAILRMLVLEGRQIGCLLLLVAQKADSTTTPTWMKNNLALKVVLGQAAPTTYETTFSAHLSDLPKRHYGPGQGLYSLHSGQPRPTSFPTLRFDLASAAHKLADTGAPVL